MNEITNGTLPIDVGLKFSVYALSYASNTPEAVAHEKAKAFVIRLDEKVQAVADKLAETERAISDVGEKDDRELNAALKRGINGSDSPMQRVQRAIAFVRGQSRNPDLERKVAETLRQGQTADLQEAKDDADIGRKEVEKLCDREKVARCGRLAACFSQFFEGMGLALIELDECDRFLHLARRRGTSVRYATRISVSAELQNSFRAFAGLLATTAADAKMGRAQTAIYSKGGTT